MLKIFRVFVIYNHKNNDMKATDVNYHKMTGEWQKHIRKRNGFKKLYNKKMRSFLKKMFNKEEI